MRDDNQKNYIYGETFNNEAPRPTAAVYEIIADNLSKGDGDIESHTALNDVYKALADTEQGVVTALDRMEQKGAIKRDDALKLTVLLAISKTLGPNLDFLRLAIAGRNFNPGEINTALESSGLDQRIISYLKQTVVKFKM